MSNSDDDQLDADISAAEGRIRREFLLAVSWLRSQTSESEMEALVHAAHPAQAADAAADMGARLATVINQVELDAAQETSKIIAEATGQLAVLDVHAPKLVAAAQANKTRLVDGFLAEQRQMLQDALFDATSRGLAPTATARELRASIGLTPQQVEYVDNYRTLLERGSRQALGRELRDRRFDPSVEAAASGNRVLSTDAIDRIVDRYRQKWLRFRADTIARTEALRANNLGRHLSLELAVMRGDIEPDQVSRTWLHRDDQKHPREFHAVMDGQERGLMDPFESGRGAQLMYPGDPSAGAEETSRCKCGLRIVIAAAARAVAVQQLQHEERRAA